MERSRRTIRVFRSWEQCPPRLTSESVLVEVPGQWVHSVVSLIQASHEYRHAGLMVTNVGPGSQGARGGMVRGDVLLRYDGQELDNAATLRRLTRTHTQGADAKKPLRIEAARGTADVAFEVLGGHLGITVSPLLHRSVTPTPRGRRILRQLLRAAQTPETATPHVVQTLEEARKHSAKGPALLLIPGDLARPVLAVLSALERAGSRKRKKRAISLLTAARRLQ
jgi:hypothetical protein